MILPTVGVWKAVFSLYPDPPQIKFKDFYGHLILVHIIFATPDLCILQKGDSSE
jgi:hypothetical protein